MTSAAGVFAFARKAAQESFGKALPPSRDITIFPFDKAREIQAHSVT
jgi:hypothetical protein